MVDRNLNRGIAAFLEMDQSFLETLAAFQDNTILRFKTPTGVGKPFTAINGNPQGDPMSMMLLNVT